MARPLNRGWLMYVQGVPLHTYIHTQTHKLRPELGLSGSEGNLPLPFCSYRGPCRGRLVLTNWVMQHGDSLGPGRLHSAGVYTAHSITGRKIWDWPRQCAAQCFCRGIAVGYKDKRPFSDAVCMLHSAEWQDDWWVMNSKLFGKNWSSPNLSHFPGIFQEALRNSQTFLCIPVRIWTQNFPITMKAKATFISILRMLFFVHVWVLHKSCGVFQFWRWSSCFQSLSERTTQTSLRGKDWQRKSAFRKHEFRQVSNWIETDN